MLATRLIQAKEAHVMLHYHQRSSAVTFYLISRKKLLVFQLHRRFSETLSFKKPRGVAESESEKIFQTEKYICGPNVAVAPAVELYHGSFLPKWL